MISFACKLARPGFDFDVTFQSNAGITALFGPSGAGKSTVIRLLAGLTRPDRGHISIADEVVLDTDRQCDVAPHKRRIGMVFQDAQLLPHLSVRANLGFGRWFTPRDLRRIGFDPVVEVLGIGHLLSRRPDSLSGGERQRVAIGRALLTSPRLLLLDEPLASLDEDRKLEILPFIEHMRDEFGIPTVYVSHAVEEVARLASRVVKIENGHVIATGTPAEVLAPTSLAKAAGRFDALSILSGRVSRYVEDYGVTIVDHPAGEIVVPGRIEPSANAVRVVIRATNVTLAIGRSENVSVRTVLAGRIAHIETDGGPFALATIELKGGEQLKAYATRLAVDRLGLDAGDHIQALVKAVAIDERGISGLHVVDQV
ncbi:MAG: molybdenum ABC transporter ATP-binding protein [Xanthobacteraceae bacterium]|nr:MAG: molybdenum ABC transporter ATP-binding protein [Xanthobacteraceae bacterium]